MINTPSQSKSIITVSQLNRLARSVLEAEIGQVWLSAEISNFVAASSGHWYFTLKDARAQVKAAMFKGANRRVATKPKEGDKVLLRANIGLYEPRGDYQLIVEYIEPEGEGQLKRQFEQLKQQLMQEGLFATEHKIPLPRTVNRVGVVTSATGAALHDILTVLKRRSPSTQVILYPTQVQGDAAHNGICDAINVANHRREVDVLIVGRGGGSLEDLWCFNHEDVARAIFSSSIPVVSAVGHEVDVSIADFVADMRAPTPSAAAELVSSDQMHLVEKVGQLQQSLVRVLANKFQQYQQQLTTRIQRLQQNHPRKQLEQQSQYLDQLENKLHYCFNNRFNQSRQQLAVLDSRLQHLSPQQRVVQHTERLQQYRQRLQRASQRLLTDKQQQLANNTHLLDTVSPLATLSRGYTISFKDGDIVRKPHQLTAGDTMLTRFAEGEVISKVLETQSD